MRSHHTHTHRRTPRIAQLTTRATITCLPVVGGGYAGEGWAWSDLLLHKSACVRARERRAERMERGKTTRTTASTRTIRVAGCQHVHGTAVYVVAHVVCDANAGTEKAGARESAVSGSALRRRSSLPLGPTACDSSEKCSSVA